MKVIHVIGSIGAEIGGPARSSQGLVAGMEASGVENWLMSFTPDDRPWYPGVKRFVAAERTGYFGQCETIDHVLAKVKPNLVHCNGIWEPYIHATIAKVCRQHVPCVIAPRGSLTAWAMSYKRWKKAIAWRLYQQKDLKKAVAFHAASESEARDIRRLGFKQPIIIVPNAVEIPNVLPIKQANGKRKVLFLARIHFGKGIRELIQAWRIARQEGWTLEIVGTDREGHQKELERMTAEYGLSDSVCFSGPVEDSKKWGVYRRADVFVLPSFSENFGISIAEALYAELPVITTKGTPWFELLGNEDSSKVLKCGSSKMRESVTSNETNGAKGGQSGNKSNDNFRTLELPNFRPSRCGWWIDIGVEPLAEALREAMNLTDCERHQMGLNGRHLVERKYTWPAVAADMKQAYEWILYGGDKPDFVW